jgi:tetratricopeptide (TPR) repeat protein
MKDNVFYRLSLVIILSGMIFNGCMTPKSLPKKQNYHSPFSGIQRLLFLECKTVPSNINSGIFSASKSDIHMLSLGICEAFRDVSHIRLSYIPQKEMIPQQSDYDALLSAQIWWQFNAETKRHSSRHQFDLIVQLQLHKKNENNRIQTRNFYVTAMQREGFILNNQLFFCRLADHSHDALPGSYLIPKLSENISQLTKLPKELPVKAPAFVDLKSKILFDAKAYNALIQYVITSRLSKNNPEAISLWIEARLSDAIDTIFQEHQIANYKKFTKQYYPEIYGLGLCFEKTGRIKKALGCYRFVIKYAPIFSRQSAEGISRCLNILAVRDHIQLAGLNIQPDTAFKLKRLDLKRIVPDEKAMAATEINFINTPSVPVEEVSIKETYAPLEPKKQDKESEIVAIQMMLDQWLSDWRSMKSAEYFRHYANDFQPEGNLSLKKWRKQRKERLKRKSIFVSIVGQADIHFLSDTEAEVLFVQDFESKGYYYKDRTKKRLFLVKKDSTWKIRKEQSIDVVP